MKKYLLLIFLAIPWFCLLGWTIYLNTTKNSGTEITVAISGYDPRELLAGHYIAYVIDWENTDCSQFPEKVCPKKRNFCKKVFTHRGAQCRFYIPEKDAKTLDDLLLHKNKNDLKFEIVYSYKKGRMPMAKKLLINGNDWREYLTDKEL